MNGCEKTAAILETWRTGSESESLRHHLRSCVACSDALVVDAAFGTVEIDSSAAPPPASAIWLRAEALRREKEAREALRPLVWAQRVGWSLVGAGWAVIAGLVYAFFDDIRSETGTAMIERIVSGSILPPATILWAAVALTMLTIVLLLQSSAADAFE